CLVPGLWCQANVPLLDEQLVQADGPEGQADAVSRWLGELEGQFRSDEVAIGVPDESLVPQLQRQLGQCGVNGRWVEGARIGDSAPSRLLAAAVRFAGRRRYEDLAALLRHPDLEDWLQGALAEPGYLFAQAESAAIAFPAQLDQFFNQRLPSKVYAGR